MPNSLSAKFGLPESVYVFLGQAFCVVANEVRRLLGYKDDDEEPDDRPCDDLLRCLGFDSQRLQGLASGKHGKGR